MFNIILLGITSLLTDISSEMVYPILPIYLVTKLGVGPAVLGLIEGVAESLASLLKVFSGYFSDRIKSRKPFAIFGYFGSAIGKFFLYISTNWGYVFIGRVVDRFGKGIRTAPRDALIADSAYSGKKGAAFGLHRAMDTLGAVIGVVAAYLLVLRYFRYAGSRHEFNGWAGKGNFKNIFLISLIPALLGVGSLFFIKEKKQKREAAPSVLRFRWRPLDKRLKLFLIFTFIFSLGNSSNQFLLLRSKELGNPLHIVILLYLVYNLVYCLFAYPAAHLSDRIGRKKLLVWGYLIYGLVYLGFAINKSTFALWFLFGIYGLYIGLTEGVEKALVADIAPLEFRATAIGLHAMFVGIGLLPASFFAGILWKVFGPAAAFYFGGVTGISASLAIWFILKGI